MAHVITRLCEGVCDTACVDVCPVDCIAGPVDVQQLRSDRLAGRAPNVSDIQLFIDPDTCIDCGACAPECPVHAIFLDDDVPESLAADIDRNEAFWNR